MSVNTRNIVPWICAFLLFLISYPKWLWNGNPRLLLFLSLFLLLLSIKDIKKNGIFLLSLVALLFQIILLWEYNVQLNTNLNGMIMVFLRGLGFATIFLCSVDYWQKTTDCFIKILAVFLIPTLIEHVLISFMGIIPTTPSNYECPTNPDRLYNAYWFNVYLVDSFDYFNRFYAFYDEPGVLGNILMVLLYTQRFDLRKWYNVIFLISGILTFSLAFYIAVAAYFILFGNVRSKIVFVIITTLAIYYFYNNEYVYHLLFHRLTVENGELVGYNRENIDFEFWFNKISWHDFLFWGYQPRENVVYAASWKWAFACFGIVPTILYFITLILSRAKTLHCFSDLLKCLMLVAVIWIQRPFVHLYLYAWLLMIPFVYLGATQVLPQESNA